MATYMMLKVDFQNLSEIEIFRKSKDRGWMLIWIINMSPWCYILCWKQHRYLCYKWCATQHNITVADFQQKCCFSATNVAFSFKSRFLLEWMYRILKNQHLLPKNNNFVENQQQWCYVAFSINYSNRCPCWLFCWKSGFGSQKIEKSRFWTESQKWFWPPHMLPWQRLK